MLKTLDGADFATGRARFLDEDANALEGTAKIFVKIEPSNLGSPVLAQLDTGCPWSILKPEIAEAINLMEEEGQPQVLSTRLGIVNGQLKRTTITIIADDGNSIDVEATVFISAAWTAGNFLGYGGLLERVRFAVDPQENFFYFGPSA
jgi:predicted aspartyl protease